MTYKASPQLMKVLKEKYLSSIQVQNNQLIFHFLDDSEFTLPKEHMENYLLSPIKVLSSPIIERAPSTTSIDVETIDQQDYNEKSSPTLEFISSSLDSHTSYVTPERKTRIKNLSPKRKRSKVNEDEE